jgi:WD40 repeat protein
MRTGRCRCGTLPLGSASAPLEGHSNAVTGVSLTPDGRIALSGSADGTLRVWNLTTGQCSRAPEGHSHWFLPLKSDDKPTALWRAPGRVWSVSLTPDGRTAVSGSSDHTLRVWDLTTGLGLHTLKGHSAEIHSWRLTSDWCTAVSGSADQTLRVWDLATGRCLRTFEGDSALFLSVRLTPNGRTAISGSEDGTLWVWDLATGHCLRILEGHTARVQVLGLTPDGRIAVSINEDRILQVWDLAVGQCITMFPAAGLASFASKVTIGGRLVFGTGGG